MDSSRLEAFSVGVMAVIITRMVLGLKAPAGASLHDLRTLLPHFLIDALSFQMSGASWNHHLLKVAKTISAGGQKKMIDHIYISVSDVEKSRKFYLEALKPLGWREFGAYDSRTGPEGVPDLYGLGDAHYMKNPGSGSSIWLRQRKKGETGLYVGIHADSTKEVEAAYAAALKAEGKDEGAPAERTYFARGYYAANIADFDGNHIEFVYKDF